MQILSRCSPFLAQLRCCATSRAHHYARVITAFRKRGDRFLCMNGCLITSYSLPLIHPCFFPCPSPFATPYSLSTAVPYSLSNDSVFCCLLPSHHCPPCSTLPLPPPPFSPFPHSQLPPPPPCLSCGHHCAPGVAEQCSGGSGSSSSRRCSGIRWRRHRCFWCAVSREGCEARGLAEHQ